MTIADDRSLLVHGYWIGFKGLPGWKVAQCKVIYCVLCGRVGQDEAVKIGWKDSASWMGHDDIKSFDEITAYFCCEARSAWPRDAIFTEQMFDGLSALKQ